MVQSVDRALRILELFIADETLSLTEVAQKMDLPKSTIFGLLATLESRRYICRDKLTSRYSLGPILLEMGGLFNSRLRLRDIAFPVMQRLCDLTNQTVQLSMLSGLNVVYIEKVEPRGILQMVTRVGATFPANGAATGKMLLACLPEKELDALLEGNTLPAITENTITDHNLLRAELAKIRTQGYAVDNRESNEQIAGFAAPVYDYRQTAVAAISLGGLVGSFTGVSDQNLRLLREAARDISRGLGCSGEMKYLAD